MSFVTVGIVGASVGAAGGLTQVLTAGKKKKEQALESHAQNMPQYQGSSALDQYYQQSLQRANTAPSQSALYKQQQNQINRQMGMGLTGAQGQGDVARLVQGTTDASMRALAGAEQQKESRFAQLGNVAMQKAAEDARKFQINQMQPFEAKYNLLAAKAAAAAQQQQAGLQNIVGAGQTMASLAARNYGGGGSSSSSSSSSS
jgi:hypothetical protein